MVCKNVHVARPSCSTSAGQLARVSRSVDAVWPCPEASPAIMAAVDPAPAEALAFFEPVPGGFQLRKAVHGLHGFPSGPNTTPGVWTDFASGDGGIFVSAIASEKRVQCMTDEKGAGQSASLLTHIGNFFDHGLHCFVQTCNIDFELVISNQYMQHYWLYEYVSRNVSN